MDIDDRKFTLLLCIVAHPEEQPSLEDFERMNPSLDIGTIRDELLELAGRGVVERVGVDGESRHRITDDGRDELQESGLFDGSVTLKHYYEKTG